MIVNRLTPKNLKRMRLVLGYKQGELAKIIRISPVTISNYERKSEKGNVSKDAAEKMRIWINNQSFDLKTLPKLKGTL
jgi:transcriptional regulator with XRE-family HTH domain